MQKTEHLYLKHRCPVPSAGILDTTDNLPLHYIPDIPYVARGDMTSLYYTPAPTVSYIPRQYPSLTFLQFLI